MQRNPFVRLAFHKLAIDEVLHSWLHCRAHMSVQLGCSVKVAVCANCTNHSSGHAAEPLHRCSAKYPRKHLDINHRTQTGARSQRQSQNGSRRMQQTWVVDAHESCDPKIKSIRQGPPCDERYLVKQAISVTSPQTAILQRLEIQNCAPKVF